MKSLNLVPFTSVRAIPTDDSSSEYLIQQHLILHTYNGVGASPTAHAII